MEMTWTRPFGLWLLLGAPLSGCFSFVTKEEGQKMQEMIDQLKSRSDQTERRAQELTEQAKKQSEELERLLGEARRLTSVLADAAQKTDKLQADLTQNQGRMEDIQKTVDSLQKSFQEYRAQSDTKIEQLVNASTTAKNPPLPETPDALYAAAEQKMMSGQWNEARRMFDAFINRNPGDRRASKAQLSIGEAYFKEGKYANAIGAYTKVIDNYAKSDEVEQAMFQNGQAFFALKYCGDSRIYFQELLRRYPKTRFKDDANELIKEIGKQLKNKAKCQS